MIQARGMGHGSVSKSRAPRLSVKVCAPKGTPVTAPSHSTPPAMTVINTATVTTPANGGTATLTFAPNADASVKEASPTSNYGNDTTLVIDGAADPDKQAYLRFTASGLTGTVTAAKLRLWVTNATGDGPGVFAAANSTWTETGITWTNKPGPTGVASDNKTSIPAGAWVEYDVTALITGNGTFSFVLMPESADDFIVAARNDPTNPPQLVVTTTG